MGLSGRGVEIGDVGGGDHTGGGPGLGVRSWGCLRAFWRVDMRFRLGPKARDLFYM